MKTNKVSLSLLLLLLLPVWTVDAQKKANVTGFNPDEEIVRLQNPQISAEYVKRMTLQWYVIEPSAKYCREDLIKLTNVPEDSELDRQILIDWGEFRDRLQAVKLRDLTGLPVVKMNRKLEEHAKFQVAMDLMKMYARGKCKQ